MIDTARSLKPTLSPLRSFAFLSFLPLFVFLLDSVLRFSYLRVLTFQHIQHFLFSFIFEWGICFIVFSFLSFIRNGTKTVTGIVVFTLCSIQLLVYGHYFYFGVLPNPYAVNYFLNHAADSLSLINSSIKWIHGLIFLILFSVQYTFFHYAGRGMARLSPRTQAIIVGLFILLAVIFNNNIRFAPASYSVTPATLFSLKYALQERWFNGSPEINNGYMRRRFEIADRPVTKTGYNCILFLSESVRKKNLSAYGYPRRTSPFLDSMIATGMVIQFQHHFSNAVSTQYSVPMILSGNFTTEKVDHPFIYDYLKRWTEVKTYFFTSQSMQRSNIDLIYNSSLDTFVCQEKSIEQEFNDLGVDDVPVSSMIRSFHPLLSAEKYFSIIQFNNTHFPYTVKPSANYFFNSPDSLVVARYDNTIREQDDLLRSYFRTFLQAGILDSTIIIFTSDHGEAFGEHGHSGHLNTLYGEEIDVPMWIYVPPGFPREKKRILEMNAQGNTSHLDLFPTIMDLYGLPYDIPLKSPYDGTSLFQKILHERIIPVVGKDMIDTKGMIMDTLKYIETIKDGTVSHEAYNIHYDINEKNNFWNRLSAEQQSFIVNYFAEVEKSSLRFTNIPK